MFRWKMFYRLFVLIILFIPSLVLADEVVLKSGQTIQGKITDQTNKYIKIDTGIGIPVTYYADEIDTIDGQGFQAAQSARSSQLIEATSQGSSQAQNSPTATLSQNGIPLTDEEKNQLEQNILYLKNQQFNNITCRLSYESFKKQDQMMQNMLKMMGGIYVIKVNWDEYKMTFDSSGGMNFNHPSTSVDINPQVQEKMDQAQPNWRSQMSQTTDAIKQKMDQNFQGVDDTTTKIMEVITGTKKPNKLFAPQKLSNGEITDTGSVKQIMNAVGASMGESSDGTNGSGMNVIMKYLYEPQGDKFIIREADIDMNMPGVMNTKTHSIIDYQSLNEILFPKKISMTMAMTSGDAEGASEQKQKEELTFDQCVVQ